MPRPPTTPAKPPPEAGTLWPVDRVLLSALALLSLLAATFHPAPARLLTVFGALALFVWAAAKLGPHSRAGDALHVFAPLAVLIGMFETIGFLIDAIGGPRWDGFFASLDVRLFGQLPAAWVGALGRPAWFSDILSVAYFSYYLVPPAVVVALYVRGNREQLDRFVFGMQTTLLLCYAGYFVFPTAGPRIPLAEAEVRLGGGPLSRGLRLFLNTFELNGFDAFPSGHTAISIVLLVYGWSMFPRWRIPLALTSGGIIFSTVYLSHHYVIDLLAGAVVALMTVISAPFVSRLFGRTVAEMGPDKRSLPQAQ